MKKQYFSEAITCLFILCMNSCQYFTRQSDYIARKDFVNSVNEHFKINYVTEHFPDSWNDESLRTSNWTACYCPCSDDVHTFYGVYSDKISFEEIDSIEQNLAYIYGTPYSNDSVLKLDIVYIDNINSYQKIVFDTTSPPIWDFRTASFLLGEEKDSILVEGNYWRNDKEKLPKDLMIYVLDAKPGNYWRDRTKAEKEQRPILPALWKHGYSRGLAISHSCQRVAWWAIAW